MERGTTYYVLDAQGEKALLLKTESLSGKTESSKEMSVYERVVNTSNQTVTYEQTEKYLYGSSRLGVHSATVGLLGTQNSTYSQTVWTHTIGQRTYELSNHLGNVLSIISDKVIPHANGTAVDYYLADVRQSSDYSPFGVQLSGRNFVKSGVVKNSKYGFNGMEMDNEIHPGSDGLATGNSYDFGARMLDPRLGRFLSVDPSFAVQPNEGVYNFAGNSPILFIDYNGHFKWPGDEKEQKALETKYPKFTKIMMNIHKMPDMYDNLIDEMSKQSGISKEEIVQNLKYGNGAKIVVDETTEGMRTPNVSEIHISQKLLDVFEKMEGEDLEIARTAVAIFLLHEEVHRGDRITNGGKITGQFEYKQVGKGFVVGGQGDLLEGKQEVKISKFGHRGSDLEVSVFGAPNDPVFKIFNNDPTKLMNQGGYSCTIDEWENKMIKDAEIKELTTGLGLSKIKQTSKALQE